MRGEPRVAAVVLAAGQADPTFCAATGVENRALAPVAGRPMAAWVLEALTRAASIERVVLVGAEGLTDAPGARQRLRGGSDLVESVERGVGACPGAAYVLLVSADVPALTPEGVDEFVREGMATGADFVYPVIPREANEARFPGVKRTYLRLADGVFTGGNLFLVRPAALQRQRDLIRRAHALRKRPFRLAWITGWRTLWRLWRGTITLAEAEAAISRLLGGSSIRAVVTEHAELGADVDQAADLEAMARFLEQRKSLGDAERVVLSGEADGERESAK
jgi:CMP-2-keto-3-deoxyoctulosonic acid synthetase